jgi:hypothetical protein
MSISSSAVLVSLNISCWPATKLDREVTDKVNTDNNANARAGKFMKDLFAGTSLRKDIEKKSAHIRAYHLRTTLPWADKGDRLLTTALFMEYKTWLNKEQGEFNQLCQRFFDAYPQLLVDAPAQLGTMYRADDYPTLEEVRGRFAFRYKITPLPDSGDFRLDIPNEERASLAAEYERDYTERLAEAMREPWERLHKLLQATSDKLTEVDGEEKKRYHETLITNAQELCALLTKLNVTQDPKLEEARRQLELTMLGADIEAVRESPEVRSSIKSKVDSILSKFDW